MTQTRCWARLIPALLSSELGSNRSPRILTIFFASLVSFWDEYWSDPFILSHEKPVVVIMDGQISLWSDAAPLFAERPRVEILDLLHATSKLWGAVHLCYPKDREWGAMKFFTWLIL